MVPRRSAREVQSYVGSPSKFATDHDDVTILSACVVEDAVVSLRSLGSRTDIWVFRSRTGGEKFGGADGFSQCKHRQKAKEVAYREKEKGRSVAVASEVAGGGNVFEIEVCNFSLVPP